MRRRAAAPLKVRGKTADDHGVIAPPEGSIDAAIMRIAKRRLLRERLSMAFAGAVVTAMVATFYRILMS